MVTHEETNPCLEDDLKFHVLTSLLILVVRQTSYLGSCHGTDKSSCHGTHKSSCHVMLSPLTEDEAFLAQLANRLLRQGLFLGTLLVVFWQLLHSSTVSRDGHSGKFQLL